MRNLLIIAVCSILLIGCSRDRVQQTMIDDDSRILCGHYQCYASHAWADRKIVWVRYDNPNLLTDSLKKARISEGERISRIVSPSDWNNLDVKLTTLLIGGIMIAFLLIISCILSYTSLSKTATTWHGEIHTMD